MNRIIFKTILLKGESGNSIRDIVKTGTDGLIDTYTVTLTDGSTSTFEVTNGNGIESITKTGTSGLTDTYTITFDNLDTETFSVTNGNGIESIEKTGTSGLTDTYTITFTNGETYSYNVINGDNVEVDDALSTTSENPVQNKVITQYLNSICDLIYPVGSIYMSVNTVNPNTLFGGTWVQIKDTFLLSAGDMYSNGSTGGEATHTLSINEIPIHAHGLNGHKHPIPQLSGTATSQSATSVVGVSGTNFGYGFQQYGSSLSGNGYPYSNEKHTHPVTTNRSETEGSNDSTSSTGESKAHNNMPPYLAVCVWKRTE